MNISIYVIPFFVLIIFIYGIYKKINVYETFLSGVLEGLKMMITIIPPLVAMIFAINIFLSSEFISFMLNPIGNILEVFNIPSEILPMAFLRPISGTATLAIMNDIFITSGPDSFLGRLASTIQGCSDTTFYVLALYFSSVKIKKTRHALKAGLFADLAGIIASLLIVKIFFG